MTYIYRWDRQGRKGQPCEVLARGKMNSCAVRFSDGYTMVTSRNAIRKAPIIICTCRGNNDCDGSCQFPKEAA